MAGEPDAPILAGCYYPGCDEEHHPKSKFCPEHGGPPVKFARVGPSDQARVRECPPAITSSPPANWAAHATLNDDGTYAVERRDR